MQLVLSKQALNQQEDKVGSLTQQLEAVQGSQKKAVDRGEDKMENGEGGDVDFDYELDTKSAEVLEARMRAASEELLKLREELSQAGVRYSNLEQRCKQEKERWRGEAQELADKIRQCIKSSRQDQDRIGELEKEIGATRKVATDSEGHLSVAQEELLAFSEELSNLYHHICVCNNLTPKRVTLDYYRDGARAGGAGARRSHHLHPQHHSQKKRTNDLFISKAAALQFMGEVDSVGGSGDPPSCPGSPTLDFRDPSNVRNLVAVIRCQIKHLQVREPILSDLLFIRFIMLLLNGLLIPLDSHLLWSERHRPYECKINTRTSSCVMFQAALPLSSSLLRFTAFSVNLMPRPLCVME